MIFNTLKILINFPPSEYLAHVISENCSNDTEKEPVTLINSLRLCSGKVVS